MTFTNTFKYCLLVGTLLISSISCTQTAPGKAAIATAHPLATKAGMAILDQGGNAFDAAVAVAAVLAVAEPYSSGLGGGGFWLLHDKKNNKDIMIDGREKAPLKAHRDLYLDKQGEPIKGISLQGPLAAGIPGVPAAMVAIAQQYGKLPLKTSLAPAINVAKQGYRIDESYRLYAKLRLKALQANEDAANIFLYQNDVPPKDYILKQPDLAKTLEQIAASGFNGFYSGDVAKNLVDGVQQAGGIWTHDDLDQYKIETRQPIQFNYRGHTISSASPPSSGGIAMAEIFHILESFDLDKLSALEKKHIVVEAMRRAYADRATYLGDPDFVNVPVKRLTSQQHAEDWAKSIDLKAASKSETLGQHSPTIGKGTDTTHYSIIDKEGNRVAATLSINYPFGACFVAPGTGVLLNDEMDDFSAKPGVPNAYGLVGAEANAIASGKRPLSSMSPTFVESDKSLAIVGTPGGSRIITMVLLAVLNVIDNMNAEQIINAKRFHHQYLPDKIIYEHGAFTEKEIASLEKMGHSMKQQTSPYGGEGTYGNMQLILWNKASNTLEAASDPRGHGLAIVR